MGNKKYAIGVDYGTLSGRAVVVDISNGDELGSCVLDYPHSVMDEYLCGDKSIPLPTDWALQHPQDYLDVLKTTIPEALKKAGVDPADVVSVGIDFTSCTVMPVKADGTPLCFDEKYAKNPHAYVKLWKHHAAQPQANKLNEVAMRRNEPFLAALGGKVSSEWFIPKVWQVLDEAPEIYDEAAYFIEAGDWVIWQLTGKQTRSSGMAGYKALYKKSAGGYPAKDFYKELDPRLENVVEDKMNCPISPLGSKAGEINESASALTTLVPGTSVAVANIDAHVAFPALGLSGSGKMLAIMGTSTVHMLTGDEEIIVPGICGVVEDGILPNSFGFEAGQGCVGDHFAWFINNFVPVEYKEEADARGMSVMQLMIEKASKSAVGESGVIALDWWNGNRSVLTDADLSGLFIGMNLLTKPEDLFRALIEATAFGTRKIIENFRENNVPVDEFYAAGGIARKDPFTMQIYADIIGMDIRIGASAQSPALGSAIFSAAAAGSANGGYDTVAEASAAMGKISDKVYHPIPENKAVYDKLYAEYELLHDYFGRGANDVMKRLRAIRAAAKK